MTGRLRVGVLGAGSIGCYIGGRLAQTDLADVVLVGRQRLEREVADHGLSTTDMGGSPVVTPPERIRFVTVPDALADCDVVLVCTKSAQTREAAETLRDLLPVERGVVSLQNGLRNGPTLREVLPGHPVVAGIVGFNVVSQGEGRFARGTSGPIQLERPPVPALTRAVDALRATRLVVDVYDDLAPHQWTKLLVNLNNAVSALSGAPTAQIIASPGYRRVVAAVMGEALELLGVAGIRPAALQGVPVGWMPRVLRLPTPLVRLVTRRQMKVDPEARSSMWEDLQRRRPTEVDFLNGEVVRLAETLGRDAPLNRRIVARVREAEAAADGSPGLDPDALWQAIAP